MIVLLFGSLTVYDLFFFEKARGLDFTVKGIEDFSQFLGFMGSGLFFVFYFYLLFVQVDDQFVLFVLGKVLDVLLKPFGAFVNTKDCGEWCLKELVVEYDADAGMWVTER